VGHAHHLAAAAERAQLAPDHVRDRAADAAVHLVKHHGRDGIDAERGDLDGKRDA